MGFWFTLRWAGRDLRRRWVQVLAIALIIAIGTGVYAGLGSTAEWRRQSNDASFALLHMYDLRVTATEGADAPTGQMAAVLAGLPDPTIVAAAEERLVADIQVDASTADQSILVPGRVVGMDLSDGGPHVNGVYVAEGDGRSLTEDDAGKPVVLLEKNFADFYDLPPERSLEVAGGQQVQSVGIAMAPEYFFVMTEEGGFFAEANFSVLFTSLETAQQLVGRPGRGQRPRDHAGSRRRHRHRGPPGRRRLRRLGHRPRGDRDAGLGRGRLPGALRRHRGRPEVLEHLRRPDPRRCHVRRVQPRQPHGRVPAARDRDRHVDGLVTATGGRPAPARRRADRRGRSGSRGGHDLRAHGGDPSRLRVDAPPAGVGDPAAARRCSCRRRRSASCCRSSRRPGRCGVRSG